MTFENKKYLGSLLVIAVLFISAGCRKGRKDAGNAAPRSVPVEIFSLKPQVLSNTIAVTGTLLSNEEVEIRSEIPGRVVVIYFQEGSRVRKGDLLVKIRDNDLKEQLTKTKLQSELAQTEETRKKKILDLKGISQEEYDIALNQLNSLKADISLIQAQIEKTDITAPFDGVIGLRSVSEGSYVNNTTLITSLQQTDPLKLEFSVPEKYAPLIVNGKTVEFTVEGSKKKCSAEIYAVEPRIDLNTRTLKVRARYPNADGRLIPGSFAAIEITLNKMNDALAIPTQALVPQLKGQSVYVCKEGKAKNIPVETGMRTDSLVQIISGLSAGDSVIVSGIMQLKNDVVVQTKKQ